ncbi:MAG: aminotransferase class V-fold PLP-dependent enzyme [Acetatifactor sp.]|nr:aminotransferase class V-fold PLP-dependent enzyme [Acetatifactor sp.]
MIYFDNAATTKYKPDEVIEAVNYYLRDVGVSPGRGSYSLGIEASRMLYKSRTAVGKYFGMSHPERVVFTKNSTEAINLLFKGLLKKGDHVIISCYEHNAVLRPLQDLKQKGIIDYSVISREDLGLEADTLLEKYANENTRMLALTLASNLTGRIIYKEDWMKFFHTKGIITFVDSSQGAGKLALNMTESQIDFLAFTGHKDLYGIPGVGGLCCESKAHFIPLIQGGTGIHGENYVNPDIFPEGYEAGTLNMPAIWALKTGIEFITAHSDTIRREEKALMTYLLQGLTDIDGVKVYDIENERVATCCFTIDDLSSDKTISLLDSKGICARGGIHCAILAHEAIGTVESGAVRISLNYKNKKAEIDQLLDTLRSR